MKYWTKIVITGSILVTLVGLGYSLYYFWPKDIVRHIPSVIYQLGEDNRLYEQQTTIVIEAKLDRNVFKEDTLIGKLNVIGDEQLQPYEHYYLHSMKTSGSSLWTLYYFYTNPFGVFIYGRMTTNNALTEIVIYKDMPYDNGKGSSWDGREGFMVAGPAYTREEAVEVSKRLSSYDPTMLSY